MGRNLKHPIMDLVVEKNVPIPIKRQRRQQYPWSRMVDTNDSFFVPYLHRKPEILRSHIITSGRENGIRIATHKEDEGIRVWYLGTQDPVLKPRFQPAMATLLPRNYDKSHVNIDFDKCLVQCGKTILPFAPNEWHLFEYLLRHAGKIVSNHSIVHLLWGHDPNGGPMDVAGVIRVMISKIRKRIPWQIEVRSGAGYIMHYDGPPLPPLVNHHRSYWTSLEAAD